MTFLNSWVLSVFAAYFVVLIGIAVVRSRQMREMQDYVLGSRRLSAATSALSAGSSAVSSGSMLVVPALAFVDGGATLWLAGSIFVGAVLSWTILARRLRRYTFAADNSLTIPEFLERRFDDRTGTLRSLMAVVTLFFVIIYISSGLVGGSKLLQETFGLEPTAGIVATLIAVASYTLVGGFLAVSRTDVFQSLLMLASFATIPAMLLQVTENPLTGVLAGGSDFLNPFNDAQGDALSWVYVASLPGWAVAAVQLLGSGFGNSGRHGGVVDLGVRVGRPGRRLGHHGLHSRLRSQHDGVRGGDALDALPIAGGGGLVRRSQPAETSADGVRGT